MFFLVQMKIKTDGTIEKGTSEFENINTAVVQFHIAMASAMQKTDVYKFTCVILDENGNVKKVEVFENLFSNNFPVEEDEAENANN